MSCVSGKVKKRIKENKHECKRISSDIDVLIRSIESFRTRPILNYNKMRLDEKEESEKRYKRIRENRREYNDKMYIEGKYKFEEELKNIFNRIQETKKMYSV